MQSPSSRHRYANKCSNYVPAKTPPLISGPCSSLRIKRVRERPPCCSCCLDLLMLRLHESCSCISGNPRHSLNSFASALLDHELCFMLPHPAHVHHSFSMKFPHRWHTQPRGFLLSAADSADNVLTDLLDLLVVLREVCKV